jgi:hypothetical protein
MKSAYDAQVYQEELRHTLSDIFTHQSELASSAHLLTLVHDQLKSDQEAFQLRLTQPAEQRPVPSQIVKERFMKIKEQNKTMLQMTLNLRQTIINLTPRGKSFQPELEEQLGLIMGKIRCEKERTLEKINRLKYLRGHGNQARKSTRNYSPIPVPMAELKNASEHLGRQALLLKT